MADPFATPTDVQDRWRTLTADELDRAAVLLADASAIIRAAFPDIDDRIAGGDLDADIPLMVAANMVKRAMIGPQVEGVESQSQTVGPFAVSQKFGNPLGNLYLTQADRDLLQGTSEAQPRAFSAPLIPEW
jgi:hypothetical protein